jgi:CDGSH-type Zn-finger protein
MKEEMKIKVTKGGPYLITGNLPLQTEKIIEDENKEPLKWGKGKKYKTDSSYALCRCGQSENKPFCDGHHLNDEVDCTETAGNVPFKKQAEIIDGPELTLNDAPDFCAGAGFCDRGKGIWDLTKNSGDAKDKKIAIEEGCNCPSGRLVEIDKNNNKEIEPKLEKSISVTTDSDGDAGPLWVKGGIVVESAKGKKYETRNRVTLCRCGKSKNKPFCNGYHHTLKSS